MTRDIPILFSAPMVRPILEGRKTQTRRVLKPQPHEWQVRVMDVLPPSQDEETGEWGQVETVWSGPLVPGMCEPDHEVWHPLKGVRWRGGDRLIVRERFSGPYGLTGLRPSFWHPGAPIWYWADGNPPEGDWTKPKPGIHMPRWASRITLLVTDVRVQRLQDISDADAEAEGPPLCRRCNDLGWINEGPDGGYQCPEPKCGAPWRDLFQDAWTTINGPGSWDANPWVAAISFERVT